MFKYLFYNWYNVVDTPSTVSRLNFWFYINIRYFKIKLNNYISFFITSLNSLKLKDIKIFYKDYSFEYIYKNFFFISFWAILFFLIIL